MVLRRNQMLAADAMNYLDLMMELSSSAATSDSLSQGEVKLADEENLLSDTTQVHEEEQARIQDFDELTEVYIKLFFFFFHYVRMIYSRYMIIIIYRTMV